MIIIIAVVTVAVRRCRCYFFSHTHTDTKTQTHTLAQGLARERSARTHACTVREETSFASLSHTHNDVSGICERLGAYLCAPVVAVVVPLPPSLPSARAAAAVVVAVAVAVFAVFDCRLSCNSHLSYTL